MSLSVSHLHISIDNKEVIKDLSLEVQPGEIHVIMGPNGSGKSTLAQSIAGHPAYRVEKGTITIDGTDVTELDPHKRAQAGLFLSMQYPPAVTGVTLSTFLRQAIEAKTGERQHPVKFYRMLQEKMRELDIDPEFAKRYLNVGFSGGEKKKAEILQLALLDPTYAILDETDSGLDVDALRIVSKGINSFFTEKKGIVLITHYNRILEYVNPHIVHIMKDGQIIKSGGRELVEEIERDGYKQI